MRSPTVTALLAIALLVGQPATGHAHDVQVVGERHQVARRERLVQPARGVGDDQDLSAELVHDANREGHFAQAVALVEMDPPAHGGDGCSVQVADHELAGVASHGRHGEIGNLRVRHDRRRLDFVGQIAEPGAQDHHHSGAKTGARTNRRRRFRHPLARRRRSGLVGADHATDVTARSSGGWPATWV